MRSATCVAATTNVAYVVAFPDVLTVHDVPCAIQGEGASVSGHVRVEREIWDFVRANPVVTDNKEISSQKRETAPRIDIVLVFSDEHHCAIRHCVQGLLPNQKIRMVQTI